ncbi:BA75_04311T0 [Komagataella pastoris]|uniref:Putative transcription factor kapC n=1 Tax=Komagataella pastoris TaxID=4922 RepID=A0A1B2JG92_PICPA|nr:BA75_04311T0 [Komagataella pastoris]
MTIKGGVQKPTARSKPSGESHFDVGNLAAAAVAHSSKQEVDQHEAIALLKNAGVEVNSVVGPTASSGPPRPTTTQRASSSGKKVVNTKRAEQNRKAQQVFRKKREEQFQELEKKAQLVDHYRDIIQNLKNEIMTLRDYTLTLQSKLIEHGDNTIGSNNSSLSAVLSRSYLGKLNSLGNLGKEEEQDSNKNGEIKEETLGLIN